MLLQKCHALRVLLKCRLRALLAILVLAFAVPGTAPAQPNILVINVDDMRDDDMAFLPQTLEVIGNQGTRFINSFSVDPVCGPSRAGLLRGQHSHNHGVLSNNPRYGGYATFHNGGLESSTLATWLSDSGYASVLIGKYMNGYPLTGQENYIPPGWGEWFALFDDPYYIQYRMNQNGATITYGNTEADYVTDVIRDLALGYLDRHKDDAAPFFMYLAPIAPHSPATPAKRHSSAYPSLKAPRSPSFNEEDVTDKPHWVSSIASMSANTIRSIDGMYRKRAQSLLAVDEMIVALVDRLTSQGKLDNTYFLFTSDNGWMNGEHRISQGKANAYEESIRVPLLIRGPGIAAGRQLEHFIRNIDIAPTAVELAGASQADFVDGHSLVGPMLSTDTPTPPTDQRFLVERLVKGETKDFTVPIHKALRHANYAYVTYPDTGELELYDLQTDPYQLNSIHASADPALLEKLQAWLAELESCAGALLCNPE